MEISPFSFGRIPFSLNMLPDELQEKVLFLLPTDDAIRCQVVQKKWKMGIKSWIAGTPIDFTPHHQKPFYFIFSTEAAYVGSTYAYISDKKRWVPFEMLNSDEEPLPFPLDMPFFGRNSFYISASRGLVCFVNYANQDNIFICNPILKNQVRLLPKPLGDIAHYCTVALSTDVHARNYVIAMVKSYHSDSNWFKYNVTIQLYRSETSTWVNLYNQKSFDWRGGDSCVICKDILYSVVQFAYVFGETKPYHAVVSCNLAQEKHKQSLIGTRVWVPCALTCVRLLNLNDKLIMVGGIPDQGTIELETIGIWEMHGTEWKEITRASNNDIINFFQRKIDQTFIASGCGNLVFIQAYTSRLILTYDFYNGVWSFIPKAPLHLMNGSNYFSGFCFEPRLDIVP